MFDEPIAYCTLEQLALLRHMVPTSDRVPLYTKPRLWVGLTTEEILDLFDVNNVYGSKWIEFARAVEAKLKEKNHD